MEYRLRSALAYAYNQDPGFSSKFQKIKELLQNSRIPSLSSPAKKFRSHSQMDTHPHVQAHTCAHSFYYGKLSE